MDNEKNKSIIEEVVGNEQREQESLGWKSNIPLNGFLLLILLTVAVFVSQYLSDVAGVDEQVALEEAKVELEAQSGLEGAGSVLLVDDFNRVVVDSGAVATDVDPAGTWREEKGSSEWGSSWTISSDSTHSFLTKSTSAAIPILAGEKTWRDLDLRVEFSRPPGAAVSILFRYGDRGDHYSLNIDEALHIDSVIEKRDTVGVDVEILAQTKYARTESDREVATVSIAGDKVRAGLEGSSFVETLDDQLTYGQIGLLADSAVVFHSVEIKQE